MKNKFAFTLAETMIVLVVIGVLSAVLIPVALNNTPDKNLMKFKKAHNALHTAIRELVSSDKYYLDGDLGTRASGLSVGHDGLSTEEYRKYFCTTLADLLNAKSVKCSYADYGSYIQVNKPIDVTSGNFRDMLSWTEVATPEQFNSMGSRLDGACKKMKIGKEEIKQIILQDGTLVWQAYTKHSFDERVSIDGAYIRVYAPPDISIPALRDSIGAGVIYMPFCIDVDGVPDNASETDCVNECPFGYGIRADGKIINGTRANKWLENQCKENSFNSFFKYLKFVLLYQISF